MNRKLPTAAALAVVPLLSVQEVIWIGLQADIQDRFRLAGIARPSTKAGQHLDQSVGRRPGRDRLFEQFERLAPAPCRLV